MPDIDLKLTIDAAKITEQIKQSMEKLSASLLKATDSFASIGSSLGPSWMQNPVYPIAYGDQIDGPASSGVLTTTTNEPASYQVTTDHAVLTPGEVVVWGPGYDTWGQTISFPPPGPPPCPQCGLAMKRGDVHGYDWCRVDGEKHRRFDDGSFEAQRPKRARREKPLPRGRGIDLKGEVVK